MLCSIHPFKTLQRVHLFHFWICSVTLEYLPSVEFLIGQTHGWVNISLPILVDIEMIASIFTESMESWTDQWFIPRSTILQLLHYPALNILTRNGWLSSTHLRCEANFFPAYRKTRTGPAFVSGFHVDETRITTCLVSLKFSTTKRIHTSPIKKVHEICRTENSNNPHRAESIWVQTNLLGFIDETNVKTWERWTIHFPRSVHTHWNNEGWNWRNLGEDLTKEYW